jgi:hypothetical protein
MQPWDSSLFFSGLIFLWREQGSWHQTTPLPSAFIPLNGCGQHQGIFPRLSKALSFQSDELTAELHLQ